VATGIAASTASGDVYVASSGNLDVYSYYSDAIAIRAQSAAGRVTVYSSGSGITADGSASTWGIYAFGYAGTFVNNAADITATGVTQSTGIAAGSQAGTVTIVNDGDVVADASGDAFGIHAYGFDDTYVGSTGAISATSATSYADGIFASSNTGNVFVRESAAVTVSAYGDAYGIQALDFGNGYAYVANAGAIDVTSAYDHAYGVKAQGNGAGVVAVNNSGNIGADGALGAAGIAATSYGTGQVNVGNTGGISVDTGNGYAIGILAQAYGSDSNVFSNGGAIDASSTLGSAYGIVAYASGDAYVGNAAAITATGAGAAAGIAAAAQGAVTVLNSGAITANGATYASYGIYAVSQYYGDVYVGNDAAIVVTAGGAAANAAGVLAYAYDGDETVINTGDIDVTSALAASGIYAGQNVAGAGDVYVANAGNIAAAGVTSAAGITAYAGQGDATVVNTGTIVSSATDYAWGVLAGSAGGAALLVNTGAIDASADHAYGLWLSGYGDTQLYNTGAITVDAYVYGVGLYAGSSNGDAVLTDTADVAVTAGGTGAADASAIGIYAHSLSGLAYAYVDASIVANATATDNATAVGVRVNGYTAGLAASAATTISANADADYAVAIGVDANGSYGLALNLDFGIAATANGLYGEAVGVQGTGYLDITAYNGADISATFTGGYGSATGVRLASLTGDIVFYNAGTITATSDYYAVAVELDSGGTSLLVNMAQGVLSPNAGPDGSMAFVSGNGDDTVLNFGQVYGAIATGAGDDTFYNGIYGTWNVVGASDMGDGDDAIFNAGTINLHDAIIDLGLPGAAGNSFVNDNIITVSGAYNIVDMEGGSAGLLMTTALASAPGPLASTNPQAFYNDGLIDFQDGAPDDVLTIVGDFGGQGDIDVDVSGLHGTGDLLYIDGDVLSNTVQHINVDMLDLPATGLAEVPVVEVSGNSVAGNFVLGSVDYTPIPFITTSFSLVSQLHTTSPDMFSVHVQMDVDPSGAIAVDLPAGVQLLVNDVVGSWHKRVDTTGERPPGKFSLWGRIYQNKGGVNPDFDSDVIDGGAFDFDQKNTGGEAGFDYAPNEKWNFGVILGKAKGDQDLRAGLGSNSIDGTVAGGYGTFRLPRGFYFDLSHRQLDFDAVVHTGSGNLVASGKARTDNAESGYSFNWHGFSFEGQVQVTHTKLISLDDLVPDNGSGGYAPPALAKMSAAAASLPPTTSIDNDADIATTTRVGWDVRKKFKTQTGTLWELHATMNRIRMVGGDNAFELTDGIGGKTDISGDSSLLDVGFTARRGLLLWYGAVTWQDGGALQNFVGAQLGAKYTW
jgi:outer membrane autotransporter protein